MSDTDKPSDFDALKKQLEELGVKTDSDSKDGVGIPTDKFHLELKDGQLFVKKKGDEYPSPGEPEEDEPEEDDDKKKKDDKGSIPDGLKKWMEENKKDKKKDDETFALLQTMTEKFEAQQKELEELKNKLSEDNDDDEPNPKSSEPPKKDPPEEEETEDEEDFSDDHVPGSGAVALLKGIEGGLSF